MRRVICLWLIACARLSADGGMILLHQPAPPYVVTVFASPAPTRTGIVDISVLLQKDETLAPVLDADVWIEMEKGAAPVRVRATPGQAQNKLLYAASVPLAEAGTWRYTILIGTGTVAKLVTVSGQINVAEEIPMARYVGYIALPFLVLAIFALHQWVREKSITRRVAPAEVRLMLE